MRSKAITLNVAFIGDEPSDKNLDKDVAFVGTQSYKRLLGWIAEMGISINHVYLANKRQCQFDGRGGMCTPEGYMSIDAVVALGKEASKLLNRDMVAHFSLPHPSGMNRQINDKEYVAEELRKCREYLLSIQNAI